MRRRALTVWLLIACLLPVVAGVPMPMPTAAQWSGAVPTSIRIPRALVDTVVEPLAIVNAVPQLPTSPWTVGWYQAMGGVGVPGNPVMYGLVDWRDVGPSVFHFADQLQPGDSIEITGGDGYRYTYRVEWVESYARQAAPIDMIFARTATEHLLTLFFDGSPFNFDTGRFENVVVVRARQTVDLPVPAPTMPDTTLGTTPGCPVNPESLMLPTSMQVYPYPVVAPYPYADRKQMGVPAASDAPDATVAAIDALLDDATNCRVAVREARLLPDGYVLALVGPPGALPLQQLASSISPWNLSVTDPTWANICAFLLFAEERDGWRYVPHPVG